MGPRPTRITVDKCPECDHLKYTCRCRGTRFHVTEAEAREMNDAIARNERARKGKGA